MSEQYHAASYENQREARKRKRAEQYAKRRATKSGESEATSSSAPRAMGRSAIASEMKESFIRETTQIAVEYDKENWQRSAACLSEDTEIFYDPTETERAKRICRTCVVKEQCLAEAITNGGEFGVWGGTTKRERKKYIRGLPSSGVRRQSK